MKPLFLISLLTAPAMALDLPDVDAITLGGGIAGGEVAVTAGAGIDAPFLLPADSLELTLYQGLGDLGTAGSLQAVYQGPLWYTKVGPAVTDGLELSAGAGLRLSNPTADLRLGVEVLPDWDGDTEYLYGLTVQIPIGGN